MNRSISGTIIATSQYRPFQWHHPITSHLTLSTDCCVACVSNSLGISLATHTVSLVGISRIDGHVLRIVAHNRIASDAHVRHALGLQKSAGIHLVGVRQGASSYASSQILRWPVDGPDRGETPDALRGASFSSSPVGLGPNPVAHGRSCQPPAGAVPDEQDLLPAAGLVRLVNTLLQTADVPSVPSSRGQRLVGVEPRIQQPAGDSDPIPALYRDGVDGLGVEAAPLQRRYEPDLPRLREGGLVVDAVIAEARTYDNGCSKRRHWRWRAECIAAGAGSCAEKEDGRRSLARDHGCWLVGGWRNDRRMTSMSE
mmetsp:Transcript_25107/g.58795  ORF Transcript_25107/g.58795 Transcript_25107/m.58795 type:complete len:312 (+) Transcript_25107:314-1249(+)